MDFQLYLCTHEDVGVAVIFRYGINYRGEAIAGN
jgi:hypothetical protein